MDRRGRPGAARLPAGRPALEVGNGGHAEGVGRVEQGEAEADILQATLHHAADIVDVDVLAGEAALLLERALK